MKKKVAELMLTLVLLAAEVEEIFLEVMLAAIPEVMILEQMMPEEKKVELI